MRVRVQVWINLGSEYYRINSNFSIKGSMYWVFNISEGTVIGAESFRKKRCTQANILNDLQTWNYSIYRGDQDNSLRFYSHKFDSKKVLVQELDIEVNDNIVKSIKDRYGNKSIKTSRS